MPHSGALLPEAERLDGLHGVPRLHGRGDHHGGAAGPAAQRHLQQLGQHGVLVGHVLGAFQEGGDALLQRQEPEVDLHRLLQPRLVPQGLRLLDLLGPAQVRQAELGGQDQAVARRPALQREDQERVRARAPLVHGGGRVALVGLPAGQQPLQVPRPIHGVSGVALDDRAGGHPLPDLHHLALAQQVRDHVPVHLHVGDGEARVLPARPQVGHGTHHLHGGPGHDARVPPRAHQPRAPHRQALGELGPLGGGRAEHGVRLARARLPVAEQAHVEAVQRALHELRHLGEHRLLARRRREHLVEGEGLLVQDGPPGIVALQPQRRPVRVGLRGHRRALGRVVRGQVRPHAHEHADVAPQLLHQVVQLPPLALAHQHLPLQLGDAVLHAGRALLPRGLQRAQPLAQHLRLRGHAGHLLQVVLRGPGGAAVGRLHQRLLQRVHF
mmetsp:Transcript_14090/g.24942  ORF Transcript_14090/g.24942 Transcript_14090/m.24942 type:complete len:440 (-) Transcript_14090:272-1591(-)